jgi:hypothetical protein
MHQDNHTKPDSVEKPPLFKTWKAWYILVISSLILFIMFAYVLTKIFE